MKKMSSKLLLVAMLILNVAMVSAQEAADAAQQSKGFHQVFKERFIEGGPMATTNSKKLIADIEQALDSKGVEAAKEVCRDTKGPVASIFYQGLDRASEGIDMVEKSVVSYGGVQMGQLEKNVSWISLFIAIAPMLGFMGTVIGMIEAFDKISSAGGLDASLIAGDIKVALLTTVFGLIVAMILQVFYNYIIAKIDAIVNDMEDASISLIDLLVARKIK